MKIYVGNLSYAVTKEDLEAEFAVFGRVESISLVTDRDTGQPRGFAFVEMPVLSEGQAAVAGLNGKTLKDRTIVVNPARAREERGSSFGGRRGGGYDKSRNRRY